MLPPHRARGDGSVATIVGLVVVALALRPQIVGIGPLLPAIRTDLDVPFGVAGLLATIPVLCMGVFAPLGPWVVRAIGPSRAIAACVASIALFGLLRAAAPDAPAVVLLTFGIGLGTGVIGPILAMVVRLRASRRPALVTGAYATGTMLGASISAALAVPLATAGGSWRVALAAFGLAAVGSVVAWMVLESPGRAVSRGLPERSADRLDARPARLPWGSVTAWALALVFGLQSILYYGTGSWIATAYVERGWREAEAALLVAVINAVGLFGAALVPLLADRIGSRRVQLLLASVLALVGLVGIAALPDLAIAWAVTIGIGLGAIFPLVLTLPVDVSDAAADVGATAALMLLVGYVVSSFAPAVLGAFRDATGDFSASLWLMVGLAVALVVACLALSPTRLQRGVGRIHVVEGY